MLKSDWNATQFFSELLANNKLAVAEGKTFGNGKFVLGDEILEKISRRPVTF